MRKPGCRGSRWSGFFFFDASGVSTWLIAVPDSVFSRSRYQMQLRLRLVLPSASHMAFGNSRWVPTNAGRTKLVRAMSFAAFTRTLPGNLQRFVSKFQRPSPWSRLTGADQPGLARVSDVVFSQEFSEFQSEISCMPARLVSAGHLCNSIYLLVCGKPAPLQPYSSPRKRQKLVSCGMYQIMVHLGYETFVGQSRFAVQTTQHTHRRIAA